MKIFLEILITILTSHKKFLIVIIKIYEIMFDLKELKLMFLDPIDLIINNINVILYRNKLVKFIFS